MFKDKCRHTLILIFLRLSPTEGFDMLLAKSLVYSRQNAAAAMKEIRSAVREAGMVCLVFFMPALP